MDAQPIKKIACYGSGVVGASWATGFIMKGYPVNVYDISKEQLEKAKQAVNANIDYLVERSVFTKDSAASMKKLVTYTDDVKKALSDVDFIQENGPENYEVKQSILKSVDEYAPATAIFASSSSGLLISEISKFSLYPQRCIGAHPFNPPHLIPLVEITKGEKTSAEIISAAVAFYKAIGKEPIVLQKEVLGYIANRLSYALYREAVDMVVNGVCSVEDVDKAVCYGPGMRWAILGPNMLYELASGTGGVSATMAKYRYVTNLVYAELADWKSLPTEWPDLVQSGVDEEKKNLPPFIGNTSEEIARFRDNTLIELLKIHGKL